MVRMSNHRDTGVVTHPQSGPPDKKNLNHYLSMRKVARASDFLLSLEKMRKEFDYRKQTYFNPYIWLMYMIPTLSD